MTNAVAKNLRCAADLIEKFGLAKHTFSDDKGAYCIRGAINLCRNGTPWGHNNLDEEEAVANYLGLEVDELNSSGDLIAGWNNKYARTKGEVISALRNTADKLETVSA
mgnify:CR=1 FL=1